MVEHHDSRPADPPDQTAAASQAQTAAACSPDAPLLRVVGLVKQFPGTLALDQVDFDVRRGEIHALVGENGAGKSTLIKILAGVYSPDAGEVTLDGEPYSPDSHRISFIHQDLGVVGSMTVAENIALIAGYARSRGMINWREVRRTAARVLESMGSVVDPGQTISSLSSAERSIVAIARALAVESDVLVLDEPTAALPESDVRRLFDILRHLKSRGMGVVFVTHRLDEVFRLADRVTVLRDGRRVAESLVSEIKPAELVHHIIGRSLSDVFIKADPPRESVLLALQDVRVDGIGPVSLEVREGEIVGLVGLRGAGQDVVGRTVFGDRSNWSGTIRISGAAADARSPRQAIRSGIAFVSSKRAEEGLAGRMTVRENIYLNPATAEGVAALGFLNRSTERGRVLKVFDLLNLRPRDPERQAGTLSGGNQQKAILGRWLEAGSRLLVLEEPTFGVDVGSKSEIYGILRQRVQEGKAVLLVSSDFEEVAGICHRALVFRRGRIVAEVPRTELSVRTLTELATGVAKGNVVEGVAEVVPA